jgi:RHS repeat-associated protein
LPGQKPGAPRAAAVGDNSQEYDRETGFYFYNARYYEDDIGRFVTADTVIDGEGDTQGWNRYSYTKNNPIRYKDPTVHDRVAAQENEKQQRSTVNLDLIESVANSFLQVGIDKKLNNEQIKEIRKDAQKWSEKNSVTFGSPLRGYVNNKNDLKDIENGGAVMSPFGQREHPITGESKYHSGIDFANKKSGEQVKDVVITAAERGTITFGTDIRTISETKKDASGKDVTKTKTVGYGYYALIKHPGGFETLYAHMKKETWQEAKQHYSSKERPQPSRVQKGDPIGTVGTSGGSTGEHLHFEIREGGKPIDPRERLKRDMSDK